MKQISARAFREVFRTLEEPVTVSTRGEGGYVKIIGTWTPAPAVMGAGDYDIGDNGAIIPKPKPANGSR